MLWSRDPRVEAQVQAAAAAARIPIVRREPPAFEDPGNPQGVAVQVTEFAYADLDVVAPPTGCARGAIYLVLDSITDPRNLGAILRSAAFFCVQAVIIPQDRAAGVTAVVERIARGATATVPVVRVVNLARTLEILQQRGVFVVGTGLEPSSAELAGYTFAPITAVVLGAEGSGLRPLVRRRCDETVRLSGSSDMQSLNVSAFATLALHLVRAQHPRVDSPQPAESR
ncbi:MAG: RNA methyltransferase [Deltaproteobacteria bacterium]|nr:RNA methyltransferase [Deltaproteobacteria bacterium]